MKSFNEFLEESKEIEQIDELSKKTLGSYVKHASNDMADKQQFAQAAHMRGDETERHGIGDDEMRKSFAKHDYDRSKKLMDKAIKRRQGINKAVNKLAKEEAEDLEEKRGLWDNIHAKRKRIEAGSGEKMRKPGSEGAPTDRDLKNAAEEVDLEESRGHKILANKLASMERIKSGVSRDDKKDDLPFEPDAPKKNPSAIAGKYGQGHSTAKHLAKLGIKKALANEETIQEEETMLTYSEFMEKIQESRASEKAAEILAAKREKRLDNYDFSKEKEKPKSNVTVHKARYNMDDNEKDEDDEAKKTAEPEVKKGRGRPKGWSGSYKRRNS